MSSAFSFINKNQPSNKSDKSLPLTKPAPWRSLPKNVYVAKTTLRPDKDKPSSFSTKTVLPSEKHAGSSFAFINQTATEAGPSKGISSSSSFSGEPMTDDDFGAPVSSQQTDTGFSNCVSEQQHSSTQLSFGDFMQFKPINSPKGSFADLANQLNQQKRAAAPSTSVTPSKQNFAASVGTPVREQPSTQSSQHHSIIPTIPSLVQNRQQQSGWKMAHSAPQQTTISSSPSPNTTSNSWTATTSPLQQSHPSSNNLTASGPLAASLTVKSTDPVKRHLSSSFIMEDMFDGDEKSGPVSSLTTVAAPASNYASLLEEIADDGVQGSIPASAKDQLTSSEQNLVTHRSPHPYIEGTDNRDSARELSSKLKLNNESSAFSFINQPTSSSISSTGSFDFSVANIQPLLSDMFIFGSSSPQKTFSARQLNTEKDSETNLLSENTLWRNFESNKQKELDIIHGLYVKESQTEHKIQQLKIELARIDREKAEAIASENYKQAQKLATQHTSVHLGLQALQHTNLQILQNNIRAWWQHLAALLEKESMLAERVIESTSQVKQDKHRYLVRLQEDHERLHRAKVQDLEKQRADVEKLKSEVAFDHDMCKQNESDLTERMDEAVHQETEALTQLESRSKTLQTEIESLRQKLKTLEAEEKTVQVEIHQIKSTVETKLKPFETELKELSDEKMSMEKRQAEIKETESKLDEEAAAIDADRIRIQEVKEHGNKEIAEFDQRIKYLTSRQDKSKIELNQLNTLVSKRIQGLEAIVTRHKRQIKESQAAITNKVNEIESLQHNVYQLEQSRINLDESVASMSARINILKRRKQLALHNGHFASAETLSTQIKELEILLEKSQEEQDRIDDAASTIDILDEEKKNLSVLEKELVDLEKTFGSELRTVLAGLKEELEKSLLDLQQQPDSSNDNILKVLVEYELAFVKSKLEHDQQELSSYF